VSKWIDEGYIRLVLYRGRTIWQHDSQVGWESVPARYIHHLCRLHGAKKRETDQQMRTAKPIEAEPSPVIERLVDDGVEIGFRVQTWVGHRYADGRRVRQWLRFNGFNEDEIDSLFVMAGELAVTSREAVWWNVVHGIHG
jgi:hypothetical protein